MKNLCARENVAGKGSLYCLPVHLHAFVYLDLPDLASISRQVFSLQEDVLRNYLTCYFHSL
jgi:hypothetical protein